MKGILSQQLAEMIGRFLHNNNNNNKQQQRSITVPYYGNESTSLRRLFDVTDTNAHPVSCQ
jgi:hypothetical protein